jgi:hypothetical protein
MVGRSHGGITWHEEGIGCGARSRDVPRPGLRDRTGRRRVRRRTYRRRSRGPAQGRPDTLERLAAVREAHPLDAYPRYWLLVNRLARGDEAVPVAALQSFLAEEAGSNLAERLRADWLRRLARDGDWGGFLDVYADLRNPDAELRCNAWSARVLTGERTVFAELASEWDALADAHPACDTPLRAAVDAGAVDEDRVWWRIRRQIDTRKPEAALASLSLLPAASAPARADLEQAIRSPAPWLDRLPPNFAVARAGRELALAALVRLAREDVGAARLRPAAHPGSPRRGRAQLRPSGARHARRARPPARGQRALRRRRRHRDDRPAARLAGAGGAAHRRLACGAGGRSRPCPPTNAKPRLDLLAGPRPRRSRQTATPPNRSMCVSPASRTSTACSHARSSARPSRPRQRPRRCRAPSSRRPSAIRACSARSRSTGSSCAPRRCANGCGACASATSSSASPPPTSRCATSSTIARSTPPSWPTRAATSSCAS